MRLQLSAIDRIMLGKISTYHQTEHMADRHSSTNIPAGLKRHLFSKHDGISRIHSVALGDNDTYYVCLTTAKGQLKIHKGLEGAYPCLKQALNQWEDEEDNVGKIIRVTMGKDDHVWFASAPNDAPKFKLPAAHVNKLCMTMLQHSGSEGGKVDSIAFGIGVEIVHHGKHATVVDSLASLQSNYPNLYNQTQQQMNREKVGDPRWFSVI